MATNANIFNSRVTSEALEAKFRQVFPAQAGAELIQDLYASGVIQPVIDFSSVAEGSFLPSNLQTAWDFSTGSGSVAGTAPVNFITNTGFWQIDLVYAGFATTTAGGINALSIYDGSTDKNVWYYDNTTTVTGPNVTSVEDRFVVFLRTGDVLRGKTYNAAARLNVWYRQIADVNGNLVNPLGFTFQ